eukprot:g906.t1
MHKARAFKRAVADAAQRNIGDVVIDDVVPLAPAVAGRRLAVGGGVLVSYSVTAAGGIGAAGAAAIDQRLAATDDFEGATTVVKAVFEGDGAPSTQAAARPSGMDSWLVRGAIAGGGFLLLLAVALLIHRRRSAGSARSLADMGKQKTSAALHEYITENGKSFIAPAGLSPAELGQHIARSMGGAQFDVHRPPQMPEPLSFKTSRPNPLWSSARNVLKSSFGFTKAGASPGSTPAGGAPAPVVEPRSRGLSWANEVEETTTNMPASSAIAAASNMTMKKSVPLPSNWSEAVDPGTGKTYYYDDHGMTTWVRPTRSVV